MSHAAPRTVYVQKLRVGITVPCRHGVMVPVEVRRPIRAAPSTVEEEIEHPIVQLVVQRRNCTGRPSNHLPFQGDVYADALPARAQN